MVIGGGGSDWLERMVRMGGVVVAILIYKTICIYVRAKSASEDWAMLKAGMLYPRL